MSLTRNLILRPRQYLTPVTPPAALEDESRWNHDGVLANMAQVRLPTGLWIYQGNNSTSIIDCGNDFIGTGTITLCCWYNLLSSIGAFRRFIDNGQFLVVLENATRQISTGNAGAVNTSSAVNSVKYNTFQHLCITRLSTGTTTHYIDGIASGAPGGAAPVVGSTNLYLGNRAAPDRSFAGYMDWKIFNKALTADEIYRMYQAERRFYGV